MGSLLHFILSDPLLTCVLLGRKKLLNVLDPIIELLSLDFTLLGDAVPDNLQLINFSLRLDQSLVLLFVLLRQLLSPLNRIFILL